MCSTCRLSMFIEICGVDLISNCRCLKIINMLRRRAWSEGGLRYVLKDGYGRPCLQKATAQHTAPPEAESSRKADWLPPSLNLLTVNLIESMRCSGLEVTRQTLEFYNLIHREALHVSSTSQGHHYYRAPGIHWKIVSLVEGHPLDVVVAAVVETSTHPLGGGSR